MTAKRDDEDAQCINPVLGNDIKTKLKAKPTAKSPLDKPFRGKVTYRMLSEMTKGDVMISVLADGDGEGCCLALERRTVESSRQITVHLDRAEVSTLIYQLAKYSKPNTIDALTCCEVDE